MRITARVACRTLDLPVRAVQKAGMMARRARSLPIVCGAALGAALLFAGCASLQHTVGGWFGGATPTPSPTPQPTPAGAAQGPRVYYVGVDGLKVYSEASTSSKVVGTLALHEKVTRTRLDRGYAYVESSKSAVKGWVNNAQLIWRLPSAPTAGTPGAAEPQPEEPTAPAEAPQEPQVAEPTAPAATPPPTATPIPQATPRGAAPSIFNPY